MSALDEARDFCARAAHTLAADGREDLLALAQEGVRVLAPVLALAERVDNLDGSIVSASAYREMRALYEEANARLELHDIESRLRVLLHRHAVEMLASLLPADDPRLARVRQDLELLHGHALQASMLGWSRIKVEVAHRLLLNIKSMEWGTLRCVECDLQDGRTIVFHRLGRTRDAHAPLRCEDECADVSTVAPGYVCGLRLHHQGEHVDRWGLARW